MNGLHSIDEIKRAVVAATGFEPRGSGNYRCPGHDDRQASLSIDEGADGKTLLHCFGGCSFDQVMSAIGLNGTRSVQPVSIQPRARKQQSSRWSRERAEALLRLAKQRLVAYHGEKVLFHRGIQPGTIAKVEIGYCDQSLVDQFGLSDVYHDRIVFPARMVTGDLVGLKFHRCDQETEPKSISLPGSKTGLFIAGDIAASDTAYVCEGEVDATLLLQVTGIPSITGTGGASTVEAAWADVLRDKNVLLFPDEDEAGKEYSKNWMEVIRRKARFGGVRSLAIRGALPDGFKDASDCVKGWASGAITGAIEHAVDVALPPVEQIEVGLVGEDEGDGANPFEVFPLDQEMEGQLIGAKPVQDKKHTPKEYSMAELKSLEIKPVRFLISELLPDQGLTILGGKPKAGKSWLALELAKAVATGKDFAGYFPVEKTVRVLALSLEDNESSLRPRIERIRIPADADIIFRFEMRQGKAGMDDLADCISRIRPGLVVIDVLQTISGTRSKPGVNVYESDYQTIKGLKDVASSLDVSILALHHLRKGSIDDQNPFESVSGSAGITGGCDSLWLLSRDSMAMDGSFYVTGRQMVQQSFAMEFKDCRWSCKGDKDRVFGSKIKQEIWSILNAAGEPISTKELIEMVQDQHPERAENTIRVTLSRMKREGGIITRDGKHILS